VRLASLITSANAGEAPAAAEAMREASALAAALPPELALGDAVAATPEALVAGAEADEGVGAATLAVAVAGGVAALGRVDTDTCAHPQRLAAARATAV
jgi:hypothetical protein